MIFHMCIALDIDAVLCTSNQMLNIYIALSIFFFHPHLTISLDTFEFSGNKSHNGIISFSTVCQPHCQTSQPNSLHKDYWCFEYWRTNLETCCLSAIWNVGCSRSLCYPWKKESVLPCSFLCPLFTSLPRPSSNFWIKPKRSQLVRIHHHWFHSVLQ